ncbi:MAG TPA: lysophospholipid acyltransferase family protein [Thermoanaerobaculia bacterium]|nr:lysophospholipid acyltransferase family protein [Thermoanaerobaculia bacterium]
MRAFLQGLAKLVLKIFFRRVEVVGEERLPLDHPMVLVANHVNGLVDAVLVVGALPVFPHLLAKSTLWKNPVVRPFLEGAEVIPVYRRQDEVDTAQNEKTFERSHEVLMQGGAIALFPEGKSHNEPMLQPLKTGLARIVLGAERKHPGLGVRIVPVGLTFDAKESFRSRALVHVGEPIDPAPEVEMGGTGNPAAVRSLTGRVDQGLKEVTLNYPSWEAAWLIGRAAELYGRGELEVPVGRGLADHFQVHRAFVEGYHDLCRRYPDRVNAVEEAVREYDRLLRASGLRDDQVASVYPPHPVVRFVLRTLLRLLVHLPLAVVGTVLNIVPFWLVRAVAWVVRRSPDQVATYKVFGGLFLYPLAWIAEAVLAARWTENPWLGALVLLAAPLTGYAAMLFREQSELFWTEARAYLLLRTRKRLATELKARREHVLREVEGLAGLYLSDSAAAP